MKKIVMIVILVLYSCITGLCFAEKLVDFNSQTGHSQGKTYYIDNLIKPEYLEVDYFNGNFVQEVLSIVDGDLAKHGYIQAAKKETAQFIVDIQLSKWGVVTMAEPGKVYKAAAVDIALFIYSKNRLIYRGEGKEYDASIPTEERVTGIGEEIISHLISESQISIAFRVPRL